MFVGFHRRSRCLADCYSYGCQWFPYYDNSKEETEEEAAVAAKQREDDDHVWSVFGHDDKKTYELQKKTKPPSAL